MNPTLKTKSSGPGLAKLREQLARISKSQVYVGVPEDTSARDSGEMTNAALVYLHTHGSALMNLPARPIIEPALEASQDVITRALRNAARNVLDQQPEEATQNLERAGMLGRNAAVNWFTDSRNGWPPDSPATIARKGSDTTLVDTGEMRRSITYLVKE